jgi:hypothetical protein
MRVCYGQPHFADFETLLWALPDKEFKNLTRSTIPLLSYWADSSTRLEELCDKLGINPGKDGTLCFQYAVKSFGSNKPSFTDIMFVSQPAAIAIEAKSTEPQYDTVEEWLKKGTDIKNRRSVARHWLDIIEKLTRLHINEGVVSLLIYQMIHRLASLCSVAASRHVMVYQVFEFEGHNVDHETPLRSLRAVLDPQRAIEMYLHTVHMRRSRVFFKIRDLMATKSENDRPHIVRRALREGKLFDILDDDTLTMI